MKEVLIYLIAIQKLCKNIHYHCHGESFYSDHLLADDIQDGLDNFIDEIQEEYFMGKEEEAPQQQDLLAKASGIIPVVEDNMDEAFLKLKDILAECALELEKVEALPDTTMGDKDLIGRIYNHLQKKNGFIWKRLKK